MKLLNIALNITVDKDLWFALEARINAVIESQPDEIKKTWRLRFCGPYNVRTQYIDYVIVNAEESVIGMNEGFGYISRYKCPVPDQATLLATAKEVLLEFSQLTALRENISKATWIYLGIDRKFSPEDTVYTLTLSYPAN